MEDKKIEELEAEPEDWLDFESQIDELINQLLDEGFEQDKVLKEKKKTSGKEG